ncbi:MAG: prepilin-type N-terminal cleavage/methylation domain-containing protein, partial [Nitrospirae bacterium]|nr:prepilin-type N-terminal cleavage/methylation domain-containing protein [Nitrospirota bacterium]
QPSGFTLLELIIAITILTLITVIIGGAFRLGIRAWEKGEKETGETQRLRVVSGLLSQQLKSVYPYKMKLEDEDEKVVIFKGEADSLLFVTTLTDSSSGGFKWVRYIYKDNALLYKEGLLPDKELMDKIKGKEEVMDSELDEFKFTYFSSEEGEWKDSWDFSKDLPSAVMVKVSYFQPFVVNMPMGFKEEQEDQEDLEDKKDNAAI